MSKPIGWMTLNQPNWQTGHLYEYTLAKPVAHTALTKADEALLEKGERLFVMGHTDFGRLLRLASISWNHILFVVAGHKSWYGRGEQRYYPKKYILARINVPASDFIPFTKDPLVKCEYIVFDTETRSPK